MPGSVPLLRTWRATDFCANTAVRLQNVGVRDPSPPVLTGVPPDVTIECHEPVPPPADPEARDNCDPAPAVELAESETGGRCPDERSITRTWTARDRCGNEHAEAQLVSIVDTTPPAILALLEPAAPLPPRSAASPRSAGSPRSVCSPPASRMFVVRCEAPDNCDPAPGITASLRVTNHDVVGRERTCSERTEEVPVACGERVELRLVAPPCPARPPRSPRAALGVDSEGIKVVTGESVVLRVEAEDRCANRAEVEFDPAAEPSPACEERRGDGICCPAIGRPADGKCKIPPCGGG